MSVREIISEQLLAPRGKSLYLEKKSRLRPGFESRFEVLDWYSRVFRGGRTLLTVRFVISPSLSPSNSNATQQECIPYVGLEAGRSLRRRSGFDVAGVPRDEQCTIVEDHNGWFCFEKAQKSGGGYLEEENGNKED